ncbi:MAG: hypothetical protein LBD54_00960 [Puniceicoccales bacterium]|jgi:ADP-heptose:LPS heptosyltransferase/lauroyl/myristoyl acyltransferase|nr:hypothetical protein [Puniceicoccales bacterium]
MKPAEVLLRGFLPTAGFILSLLPSRGIALLAALLGRVFYYTFPRRRRTLLSNLDHAFPQKSWAWKRRIGRTSCGRMMEMGCLALVSPFFSKNRLRKNGSVSEALGQWLCEVRERPRPVLLWIPHLSMMEAATWLPIFAPELARERRSGVLFRPLENPWLDAWLRRTRERFGLELLSRKDGLLKAKGILRAKGIVAFLGDQSAGKSGILSHFMGRLASSSPLADLLAPCGEGVEVYALWTRRRGFARVHLELERLVKPESGSSWAQAGNDWLGQLLRSNESICEDWLWVHRRWHTQDEPQAFLHLDHRRNLLLSDPAVRAELVRARATRLWVRLPNWLGDFVMAVPLLRKLHSMRPDAAITLLGPASLAPLVSRWQLADRFLPLPPKGWDYFPKLRALSGEIPDFYILLTHSLRSELEAKVLRAHETFGLQLPQRRRIFVRHPWKVPADFQQEHQSLLWERFFRSMGLREKISRAPQETWLRPERVTVGLVFGSANLPAKRWPLERWESLASRLLSASLCGRVLLLGTAPDAEILSRHRGFSAPEIIHLEGETDLRGLADALGSCSVVVGNDTGALHLANALGVPCVVLYGPTSPQRTGLFFAAPHRELQSPTSPSMEGISVEAVEAAVLSLLF